MYTLSHYIRLRTEVQGTFDDRHDTANKHVSSTAYKVGEAMSVARGDLASDPAAGAESGGGLSSEGAGESWQQGVDFAKAASDGVVNFVSDLLARHG